MAIRVHRIALSKPGKLREMMKMAYDLSQHMERETGKETQIYCSRFSANRIGSAHYFMDFDSMAEYEELFINKMLKDRHYLQMLARGADLLEYEPTDELIFKIEPDDFFMNLDSEA